MRGAVQDLQAGSADEFFGKPEAATGRREPVCLVKKGSRKGAVEMMIHVQGMSRTGICAQQQKCVRAMYKVAAKDAGKGEEGMPRCLPASSRGGALPITIMGPDGYDDRRVRLKTAGTAEPGHAACAAL